MWTKCIFKWTELMTAPLKLRERMQLYFLKIFANFHFLWWQYWMSSVNENVEIFWIKFKFLPYNYFLKNPNNKRPQIKNVIFNNYFFDAFYPSTKAKIVWQFKPIIPVYRQKLFCFQNSLFTHSLCFPLLRCLIYLIFENPGFFQWS